LKLSALSQCLRQQADAASQAANPHALAAAISQGFGALADSIDFARSEITDRIDQLPLTPADREALGLPAKASATAVSGDAVHADPSASLETGESHASAVTDRPAYTAPIDRLFTWSQTGQPTAYGGSDMMRADLTTLFASMTSPQ